MTQEWLQKQMKDKPIPNTDEIRWKNKLFHTNNIYFIKHLWSCSWDITELPTNIIETSPIIDFIKMILEIVITNFL